MVSDFIYYQPVKIIFGMGRIKTLSDVLKEVGVTNCVLVCDPFFSEKAYEIQGSCEAVKAVFSDVEPNPKLSGANAVAELAKTYHADAIIGMGGGSSMDTAKFAAAIAMGGNGAEDYFDGKLAFPAERLKIISVPTTSGTGSEVTQVSVMNKGDEKRTINNPAFMPAAAVIDPELMMTVPSKVTMSTGLDALSHALEGYWSKNHQPMTDLCAVEAVRIILENLENACLDGSNVDARCNMAYAALLAGIAFGQPKTAACHACSYPLSMTYHMPHGEACAFTLDSFVRLNADARLEKLARSVELSGTEELAQKIAYLKKIGGMRCRFSDFPELKGKVDLTRLAQECAEHPLMKNNPVPFSVEELRQMFEKLM